MKSKEGSFKSSYELGKKDFPWGKRCKTRDFFSANRASFHKTHFNYGKIECFDGFEKFFKGSEGISKGKKGCRWSLKIGYLLFLIYLEGSFKKRILCYHKLCLCLFKRFFKVLQ